MKQQKGGNFLPGKQLPGTFLRLRFFPRPLTYIVRQEGHAFCIPRFLVTGRAHPSRDYMKGKEAITIQLGPSPTEPLLPQQLSPHGFFPFYFPLLPWSKHVQSHLPLWKAYVVQIHLWTDFSKRCLLVQCWDNLETGFFEWGSRLDCSTHPRHSGHLLTVAQM